MKKISPRLFLLELECQRPPQTVLLRHFFLFLQFTPDLISFKCPLHYSRQAKSNRIIYVVLQRATCIFNNHIEISKKKQVKLILIKYCLFNAMYPKYYHFSKLSVYKLTILYLCVCVLSLGNLVDIFHLKHTSIQTSHIYFLFLFLFFNFNFFKHLFWSISALHWCVSFCFIGK